MTMLQRKAGFKLIKTEFVDNNFFKDLEDLSYKLFDYVNWYNNFRVHGSLGCFTPVEYIIYVREKNCINQG